MSVKNQQNAFKGFEVFHSDFMMVLKMHLHLVAILAVVQGIIFWSVTWLVLPALQRQLATSYIVGNVARLFFFNPNFTLDLPSGQRVFSAADAVASGKAASAAHWSIGICFVIFLASCSIYLLLPMIIRKFAKQGEKLMEREHIRGVKMLTEEVLTAAIKATGAVCNLMIGNVPWPFSAEPEHLIIYGKTRVGKTVAMFQFLAGLRAKNAKAMILDIKLDYIMKWYDPSKGDQIFNILDIRSLLWNIFNELKTIMDVDAVASSVIPDAKGGGSNEAFFNDAARAVFTGALHSCISNNTRQPSALRNMIYQDTQLLHDAIENTKAGQRGAQFLQQPTSALAGSVIAVLTQYCGWLDYLGDDCESSTFSFVDWLTDGKPGFLYIASNDEVEKILRPVISLAFDLIARKVNSLPDNRDNRVYLCADEFGSLQRLSAVVPLLTKGGGKGLITIATIQDFAQIEEIYGKNLSKTINNSFGTVATLKLKDPDTAEYLSKTLGREEFWESQETMTMKSGDDGDGRSITKQKRDEPVATATQIQYLAPLEYYIQIPGYDPAKGKLQILPVNNLPQINPPFLLRDGLTLEEVYAKEKAIAEIEKARGIFDGKTKEKEEELEVVDTAVIAQAAAKNLDGETAGRLVIEEDMRLF